MRARDTTLANARVTTGRLTGARWTDCGFRDVLFQSCRADLAGFRFSRFKDVVFRDCTLTEADFQEADLRGVRFERCRLAGAQFSGAAMEGARFEECDLYGIGGAASLRGVVVRSDDLQSLARSLAGAMGIVIEDAELSVRRG